MKISLSDDVTDVFMKRFDELEKYVDDLSNDVKEMIMDSTQEEKSMLKQKLMGMANNL